MLPFTHYFDINAVSVEVAPRPFSRGSSALPTPYGSAKPPASPWRYRACTWGVHRIPAINCACLQRRNQSLTPWPMRWRPTLLFATTRGSRVCAEFPLISREVGWNISAIAFRGAARASPNRGRDDFATAMNCPSCTVAASRLRRRFRFACVALNIPLRRSLNRSRSPMRTDYHFRQGLSLYLS